MPVLERAEINDILYRLRKGQSQEEVAEATGVKRGLVACVAMGALTNEGFGKSPEPLTGMDRSKGVQSSHKLSKYRQPRNSYRP